MPPAESDIDKGAHHDSDLMLAKGIARDREVPQAAGWIRVGEQLGGVIELELDLPNAAFCVPCLAMARAETFVIQFPAKMGGSLTDGIDVER